jgi:hypothetical protein
LSTRVSTKGFPKSSEPEKAGRVRRVRREGSAESSIMEVPRMSTCRVLRESVRAVSMDGREFVLSYSFAVRDTDEGPRCLIQASLRERSELGLDKETGCSVEMSRIQPEVMRKIFEAITSAEDPVFPVHVPEIVHDQLSPDELLVVKDSL